MNPLTPLNPPPATPALDRSVRDRAAAGDASGALRLINGTRGMTPAYAALLQADVALALFQAGQDEEAFRAYHATILDAIQRSGAAISHHHGIGKMFAPWLEGYVGETEYGARFTSAVARDNIFATQFHPEKSADQGLALYRNFLDWNP